jgi:type 2 lantibiotic biosynthesis protein LanM
MSAAEFEASLGCLIDPAVDNLAAHLLQIHGLRSTEAAVVLSATREALLEVLHSKLCRLLLLELNAARVTRALTAATSEARWHEFIEMSSRREFWGALKKYYPQLLQRIDTVVANRCHSARQFADRLATDRPALAELLCHPFGVLQALKFGAGDSHRGGQTVAIVSGEGGRVVYKPRPVDIDIELGRFVDTVLADRDAGSRIRVPRTLARAGYGWAEMIEHRYTQGEAELKDFYRSIGHWLAIMRLLAGNDLHAENLIASGNQPVVVDCETLFAPIVKLKPSGWGMAVDSAAESLSNSVLTIGLLPARGMDLGWRGVDVSALGALPGQQPRIDEPTIIGAGTDEAHMGSHKVDAPIAQNHPSISPALMDYWEVVLQGFEELTQSLRALDAAHQLLPMLQRFAPCQIRVVLRSTDAYMELARMLWHPTSLHNQGAAEQRARELLAKMAEQNSLVPNDDAVIHAEIAELLEGDIPYFGGVASDGRLKGPRGTTWLPQTDLTASALDRWRRADWSLERQVLQASLVSAFSEDGWRPARLPSVRPRQIRPNDLQARRREQARRIIAKMNSSCIRGQDGTVTWISPVLGATGCSVEPLSLDLYDGLSGVALVLAAYQREVRAGRAAACDGLEDLLARTLRTLHLAQIEVLKSLSKMPRPRPPAPGAYTGLGSQVWTWVMLARWGVVDDGIVRARELSELIPESAAVDQNYDLLSGLAGAIVPLLMLAEASGESRYLGMAVQLGDQLSTTATRDGERTHWSTALSPQGEAGFAHGATGIAWSLLKLAAASHEERFARLAQAALAFDESLYSEELGGWRNLRDTNQPLVEPIWCNGSVGIGLALADLFAHTQDARILARLRTAIQSAWPDSLGFNHSLCHGDLGTWELLDRALSLGLAPAGLQADALLAHLVTSLEEHGPVCGWTREVYSPSLMVGEGGVAYQLLRAHPESDLPSVLVLAPKSTGHDEGHQQYSR